MDDLRRLTVGDRGERLIDWGCGTGELTIRLSPYFDTVTAVDMRGRIIEFARDSHPQATNVEWLAGKAEDLEIAPESCDLITAASSFHLMDRELLAGRAFRGLKPGGSMGYVVGGEGEIRRQAQEWHGLAAECVKKHASPGPGRRWRARPRERSAKPLEEIFAAAGFEVETREYGTDHRWGVRETIGYLYSIHFAAPYRLGDRIDAFERELRESLLRLNPEGVFRERIASHLSIARKPRPNRPQSPPARTY